MSSQPPAPLPPTAGLDFTPTTHSQVPLSLLPEKTTLHTPFTIAITGAGKGLGYHIALSFAQAGASHLAICSRTLSDLRNLSSAIKKINPDAEVLEQVCDTTKQEDVDKFVSEVESRWGRLDVCIANAGIISKYITPQGDGTQDQDQRLPIGLLEDSDWDRVLSTNLSGTWRIARAFLPLLIRTPKNTTGSPRSLIVITSLASHSAHSTYTTTAYNISKLAINRLVEHIDSDHGPKTRDGVNVFAVHPGAVMTPQTEGHKGEIWKQVLVDEVGLAGAWCVWLCKEQGGRGWLSGRYVSVNWDVEELEEKKEEILERDLLKFRMVV